MLTVAGVLLAACSNSPEPVDTSPTTQTTPGPSASPTPTSTLTAEEGQAVGEATEAIRAYAQTYLDILADPTPNINDINAVAAEPQLDIDLRNLQQQLGNPSDVVYESTGPIMVAGAKPQKIALKTEPPTVVLLACVDNSGVRGTEGGEPRVGPREELIYRVVMTNYLPAPGWAVAEVLPPDGYESPQPC